jgi:hypothetical protein
MNKIIVYGSYKKQIQQKNLIIFFFKGTTLKYINNKSTKYAINLIVDFIR